MVIGWDLNIHVGALAKGYEGVHGGSGFGVRNTEGVRVLEFGDVLDMIVCNTMFKKRPSRLITYESGGIKSQRDYFLVGRLDRKLVKDVKTIGGEECSLQHQLLMYDVKLEQGKEETLCPKEKSMETKRSECKGTFLYETSGNESWKPDARRGCRELLELFKGRAAACY